MSTDRHRDDPGRARALAWSLCGLGALFVFGSFFFILATVSVDVPSRGFGFRGWVPLVAILWLAIGARIAGRQPRLSVGWLILAVGFLWSVNALFEEYATFAYFPQEIGAPFVPQAVWFNNMVATAVAGLAALALLVVPDGKLRSRRWLPLVSAVVIATILSISALAVIPRRLVPFPFDNPFGLNGLRAYEDSFPVVLRAIDVVRGLEVLLPTAALLLRLRSATGVRRQQLKWVAFPATFTSILVFMYAFVDSPVVQYAQILGLILVPLSFGVAMRRYRLYDIDRILNRTIVIGGTTALLAGFYIAGIGVMQRAFIAVTGERSDAAVVLTTLLAAAAFTPLKERVHAVVIRTFAAQLPGTRGLDAFTNEIDEHLRLSDHDRLLTQLLAESVDSLGAVAGAIEVTDGARPSTLGVIGPWSGDAHLIVDVRARRMLVARLLLGPRANGGVYDEHARSRLDRAARVVGLALERLDQRLPYASRGTRPAARQ